MQRIVKRFLLHNQRESDGFEKEFQELKQDLQMIRYEMTNDLKRSKEDAYHCQHLIHAGLNVLGDEVFRESTNEDNLARFNEYKHFSQELNETFKEDEDLDVAVDGDENGPTSGENFLGSSFLADKGGKVFSDAVSIASDKNKADLRKKTFYDVVSSTFIKRPEGDENSLAKNSVDKMSCDESFELTQQNHSTKQVELDAIHLIKDQSVDQ
jgi:hypothetical protein